MAKILNISIKSYKDSKYFHKVLYMDKEEMQLCYPKRKDWDISHNQGDNP